MKRKQSNAMFTWISRYWNNIKFKSMHIFIFLKSIQDKRKIVWTWWIHWTPTLKSRRSCNECCPGKAAKTMNKRNKYKIKEIWKNITLSNLAMCFPHTQSNWESHTNYHSICNRIDSGVQCNSHYHSYRLVRLVASWKSHQILCYHGPSSKNLECFLNSSPISKNRFQHLFSR